MTHAPQMSQKERPCDSLKTSQKERPFDSLKMSQKERPSDSPLARDVERGRDNLFFLDKDYDMDKDKTIPVTITGSEESCVLSERDMQLHLYLKEPCNSTFIIR